VAQARKALNFDARRNCAILKKLSVNGFFVCVKWGERAGRRGREEPEVERRKDSRTLGSHSEPATLVTLASYAGRNFETESAVSHKLRSDVERKARAVTVVVLV
jgi:hypothetical protein